MKTLAIMSLFLAVNSYAAVEATLHFEGKNVGEFNKAKFFSDSSSYRMDMEVPGQGRVSYIENGKTNKTYSVMHETKTAMVVEKRKKAGAQNFFMSKGAKNIEKAKEDGYKVKSIGSKTIQGYQCKGYEITGTKPEHMKTAKGWFSTALDGLMLQMEGIDPDGSKVKVWMSDIKKTKHEPSVYVPPYKTKAMPDFSSFSQGNMMERMQKIQQLPPAQRKAAMESFEKEMRAKAEEMKRQYGQ